MNRFTHEHGAIDAIWRFLASIKLTVALLLALAITSVIGTLIPQNADPQAYVRAYGEFVYRLLYMFDLFDMYYSWWFQTLLILLTINISVCTLKRWPTIWRIVSAKTPRLSGLFAKKPLQDFSDSRSPDDLDPICIGVLKKHYRHVQREKTKAGFRITAEKGRWSRLGVPVVHLSVVIILSGALVGSLFGFDGYVNIPEGEGTQTIRMRNSDAVLPLGFTVRCDDFEVSFYESGAPREFRSHLAIEQDGQRLIEKDIIVNDPLRFRGVNFFQSSYGAMPPDSVELRFTPNGVGESFKRTLAIGQGMNLPTGEGRFVLRDYNRSYRYQGRAVGAAAIGILERPGQSPQEVVLPLRFPTFDKMRKGDWIIAVEGHEDKYYTGLQVTQDPGVPLVYLGFVLMILGCWVTFFVPHQKVALDISPSPNSSRVNIYGTTSRNTVGFELFIKRLADQLRQA